MTQPVDVLSFVQAHGPGPHTVSLPHRQVFGTVTFDAALDRIHIRHMDRVVTAWLADVVAITGCDAGTPDPAA